MTDPLPLPAPADHAALLAAGEQHHKAFRQTIMATGEWSSPTPVCGVCGYRWPCLTSQLAAALREAEQWKAKVRDITADMRLSADEDDPIESDDVWRTALRLLAHRLDNAIDPPSPWRPEGSSRTAFNRRRPRP